VLCNLSIKKNLDFTKGDDFIEIMKNYMNEAEENVEKDNFRKLLKNNHFRNYTSTLFTDLRKILMPYIIETDWQFGTQVFPRDHIFGWSRTAYPWDYFFDPFAGKNPPPLPYAR
jgi:hypothetical protein